MPSAAPAPLPANRDLAFVGERIRREAQVPAARVPALLAARNPHGKPNADVLRRVIGADGKDRWIVDFPAAMTEDEAALYSEPFTWLVERLGDAGPEFWRNPHAQLELRAALARRTRALATPRGAEPEWAWIDAELLPDDTLLVVARDDDFTHGVLASRWFRVWWETFHEPAAPERVVNAFPFPWALDETSKLSREQDEARFAVNRAARAGDQDAIDAAVAQAYGWAQPPTDDEEALARLRALHAERSRMK